MDFVKHECGVAIVRLLKPSEHFEQRYGDLYYGLHLLESMMIRQYNRGQDGAGIGCIDMSAADPLVYQIRRQGPDAVEKMATEIDKEIAFEREWGSDRHPYYGNLMLGHVRYSTTGGVGEEFLHPFRHDHSGLDGNGEGKESFLMCGNFHLINTDKISGALHEKGVDICAQADTQVLLNDIALAHWDSEGNRRDITDTLAAVSPMWDGGFVICGIDTNGDTWAVRDSHGIRPAFWFADEEKVILASERSAIALCAGVANEDIHVLKPGVMMRIDRNCRLSFKRVIEEKPVRECVFERIYFSRADSGEITLEREKLGYLLAERLMKAGNTDIQKTYFSFVPASARSSFMGMVACFAGMNLPVSPQDLAGDSRDKYVPHVLESKAGIKVNFGRIIEKGKALRTFISTETGREELVEKTYKKVIDSLPDGINRIVIVDDSIVRGTTLKSSVISILDSFGVDEITIVSCAPQVRYPDFYGIDMSRLGELVAFRAAINILRREGNGDMIDRVYQLCRSALAGEQRTRNFVRLIYNLTSEEEISEEVARMVTPDGCHARVKVRYLNLEDLRKAIPNHTGDWCFSGNYPTSGAYTKICQAYVNYYEGRVSAR